MTLVSAGTLIAAILSTAAAQTPAPLNDKMPWGGFLEPARLVRAKGWKWDHEVRVWLPSSYKFSTRTYPTLWVTDNNLEIVQAAMVGAGIGKVPELIVVAVGSPRETGVLEFQRRRTYDFMAAKSVMGPMFAGVPDSMMGGADGFLDFLVNQLRPELARQYRMDPNDHWYAGHSGGAQFGLYVLFNQPQSFTKYLISSPAANQPWLDMEAAWFRQHKDLPARVFLSAGDAEAAEPYAYAQILSTTALVAERLAMRKYPSLVFETRVFPGEDHLSVLPIAYAHGIRFLAGSSGASR
jgi:predicted alpha/beta superfamily hydrolase